MKNLTDDFDALLRNRLRKRTRCLLIAGPKDGLEIALPEGQDDVSFPSSSLPPADLLASETAPASSIDIRSHRYTYVGHRGFLAIFYYVR